MVVEDAGVVSVILPGMTTAIETTTVAVVAAEGATEEDTTTGITTAVVAVDIMTVVDVAVAVDGTMMDPAHDEIVAVETSPSLENLPQVSCNPPFVSVLD